LQKTNFYDLVGLYQSSLEVVKSCDAINREIKPKYIFGAVNYNKRKKIAIGKPYYRAFISKIR